MKKLEEYTLKIRRAQEGGMVETDETGRHVRCSDEELAHFIGNYIFSDLVHHELEDAYITIKIETEVEV